MYLLLPPAFACRSSLPPFLLSFCDLLSVWSCGVSDSSQVQSPAVRKCWLDRSCGGLAVASHPCSRAASLRKSMTKEEKEVFHEQAREKQRNAQQLRHNALEPLPVAVRQDGAQP